VRPAKVSDEQILTCIKRGLNPSETRRVLGIAFGSTFNERIRKICEKNGLDYGEVKSNNNATAKEKDHLRLVIQDRRVVKLEIQDGSILVGTDPHYSRIEHVSVAHKAFCNVLADLRSNIRAVVLNGDLADFGCVSRFPRGAWRNPKRPTVKQEIEAVQERLSEIEKAGPKNARYVRNLGNHDDRFEIKLSAASESLEGLHGTRLSDHIPRWTEAERIDVNDDCEFIHNIRSGEIGRDRQNVQQTGHHTIVGHSHHLHVWPQTWRRGTFFGVCAGTLADLDDEVFSYLGSRPANWQSGFVLLTWVQGTLMYPECAAVVDGKVMFRGTRYA
jgi:hypothetical protein